MNALASSSRAELITARDDISRALLDQLATCVVLLDENRGIVILNTAAETLLEASATRLGGSDIAQVIDLDDTLDSLLSQALENNYPVVKRELDILLRGGQRFCVDFVVSPISLEQAPHLLLEFNPVDRLNAISEDEHMWQAQASLRQIIRGLAHEVKNPLGGIRGAAQLLARELESPTLREYTDVIMEEVDRLRALVDRLLGPRERLHPRLMNIHEVLERVKQLIEVESEGAVSVVRNYDPSLPEFNADPDQITQIILNISRNAVQALQGRGRITFKTRAKRQYTLGGQRHKLVCAIDIVDPGPGIPPDILPQLFLPMVSSRARGAGLGLSIAQMIANRHGGLIQCQSEPGDTCFTLLLPMEG